MTCSTAGYTNMKKKRGQVGDVSPRKVSFLFLDFELNCAQITFIIAKTSVHTSQTERNILSNLKHAIGTSIEVSCGKG